MEVVDAFSFVVATLGEFGRYAAVHTLYRGLIQRLMLGHMLYAWRIGVSAVALVLVCGVVYANWAELGQTIIAAGAGDVRTDADAPWSGGWWSRAQFGLYFSLTTFVTLGYGDYAPAGWFKLVTGLEAFLGVPLLALFTVAWGRKMIR